VEDRGPGIPANERAAVLEPFYRGDEARNLNQRGFGLGLAIVSEVVKAARGTLVLDDRVGGGLVVRLTLPLA
jgi:signal transduction histidine kinase